MSRKLLVYITCLSRLLFELNVLNITFSAFKRFEVSNFKLFNETIEVMYGYHLYTDSLKVINEDIHQHCAKLGYRIGRLIGRDFYTNTYESYWIDESLDEVPLVIKVIDFTHENQSMFAIKPNKELNESQRKFKKITVKVGKKKTITIETTISRKFVPDYDLFRNEINELNYLNHQNLVIIRNILLFDKKTSEESETRDLSHVLMFIEFNNNTLKQKLKEIVKKSGYVSVEQSINWTAQIVRGLAYLHSRAISHSNLKPSNIIVFNNKKLKEGLLLKLSDFGLAMMFPIKDNRNRAPDEDDLYRDPQIDETFSRIRRKKSKILSYSATRADIWSLAVIITELRLDFQTIFKIFKENVTNMRKLPEVYLDKLSSIGTSKERIDLLSKILIYEQNKRVNILAVSQHQWISEALKMQRKVSQVVKTTENVQNGDKIMDDIVDEDSKTNISVDESFGLNDNKCEQFISDDEAND